MRRRQYERAIQTCRIATAVMFAMGGAGIIICARLQLDGVSMTVSSCLLIVAIVVFVLLVLEQLIAAILATFQGRFSVASLMVLTVVAAIFFAFYRKSPALSVFVLCIVGFIVAMSLETRRLKPDESSDDNIEV